jgi:hypothetical protein
MNRFILAMLLFVLTTTLAMAATAKDMVGSWSVDIDATWNKLKDLPEMKALTPEMSATVKSAFATQSGSMLITFTDDRITTVVGGVKREETYVIISIDGDTITAEGTDSEGKKERSLIRFADGTMELTSVSSPLQKVVLRRK